MPASNENTEIQIETQNNDTGDGNETEDIISCEQCQTY